MTEQEEEEETGRLPIRIIVALDIPASSLDEAYEQVYRTLGTVSAFEWESTDEWFDSAGEPVDPDDISTVRQRVIERLQAGAR